MHSSVFVIVLFINGFIFLEGCQILILNILLYLLISFIYYR